MSKRAIGYITMNAGDGIPGSILKWALSKYAPFFDYSVVVDGDLTENAKTFYSTIPNLRVVNSPWTGRHVNQYYARNSVVADGDWLLALDDDEYPSDGLLKICDAATRAPDINIVYTPSLTYLKIDRSDRFYRVQTDPSREDFLRRSKRILYKKSDTTNYFIHSPCGMHVTPTQVIDNRQNEKPAADPAGFFIHAKTLESFILNECIYVISNPRHESGPAARKLTKEQEDQLVEFVVRYNLNRESFIKMTKERSWPKDFQDWTYQFENHHGQAMCKFFYLYEILAKNSYSLDQIMPLVNAISTGFVEPLQKAISSQDYIELPHTPTFWNTNLCL